MKQDWEEVVGYARNLLAHQDKKIMSELMEIFEKEEREEIGEEVAAEQTWQQMQTAIDKALSGKLRDTNDYDALVQFAAWLLRDGNRLPAEFATFIADVLEGKISRPTKRGPDPYRDWLRNCMLSFAARAVAAKFGIARYESGNTNNQTAADAVGEAAKCTTSVVRNALKSFPLRPSLVAAIAAQLTG